MKKIFAALLALVSSVAFGTTLVPIQLLNPTGSTAGQMLVSSGASSAPAWSSTVSNITSTGTASFATTSFSVDPVFNSGLFTDLDVNVTGGGAHNIQVFNNNNGQAAYGIYDNTALRVALGCAYSSTQCTFYTRPIFGSATPWDNSNMSTSSFPAFTMGSGNAITPSSTSGIKGTTAADNASAGSDGEYVTNTASGVSLTNNVVANITSISLTAGDWDVSGTVSYSPAATTTVTGLAGGVSQTSATLDTMNYSLNWTFTTGTAQTVVAPVARYNVSTTTTIYLVARSSFGTSTMTAGGTIRARRVR